VGQFTTNQAAMAALGALAVPDALFRVSLPTPVPMLAPVPMLVLCRRHAEDADEPRDERPPRDRTPHVLGRVTVGQRKDSSCPTSL